MFGFKLDAMKTLLMCKHFVKKHFLLVNKNYASYGNQIVGNEFGIFSCIIITQFPNFTNNFNLRTLAQKINDVAKTFYKPSVFVFSVPTSN